eukprot:15096328-Alexandrium_andersonii.AAC.1
MPDGPRAVGADNGVVGPDDEVENGVEPVVGVAPAERLCLGRGPRPSSPGGASGSPPDMARK